MDAPECAVRPALRLLAPAAPRAGVATADIAPRARALIGAAAVVALVCSLPALLMDVGSQRDWAAIAVFAALGMLAERFDVDLYGDSRVSVSALFMIAAAVALGPGAAVVICPAIAVAGHAGRARPPYKLIFNAAVFTLAGLASAYVYAAALALSPYDGRSYEAAAVVAAALANFAVASALVAAVVALTTDVAPTSVWREKHAWLLPHFAVLGVLAFILVLAQREFGAYAVAGFAVPVLMTRFTMKQYVGRTEHTVRELREKHREVKELSSELEEAYNETLAAFVSALDTRDVETQGHSQRVAELSLQIGEALGVARESREWLDLKHGAMLHDVGKIGVPDAILRKPEALTAEEWQAMKEHPAAGYRMLRGVRFLASAAELVLCHHEHYDGAGYPRGLRGEEIPLAARIFAVADAFDAITSERPYKAARSVQEACEEIRRNAGTQFDPRVVEELLRLKEPVAAAA